MLLNPASDSSKEYRRLLINDFRKRVYPLALACALIFAAFFTINILGFGKEGFIVPDAIVAVLFLMLGFMVKIELIPPVARSISILSIIMMFFVVIIIYSGSVHGVLFYFGVMPFFAFYMTGTRIGNIHSIIMMFITFTLWTGSSMFTWFSISYSHVEMFSFAFLLSFSSVWAWVFEKIREQSFYNAYQQSVQHDALMHDIDEVYYRVGMDGIIEEIGEAIFALTGFKPNEVASRHISMFYANPDERDAYLKQLKQEGNVKNYPIEILGKQGQHVFILMSSRIVFNEQGKSVYIEGMFRDITKEQQIERELTEHLNHLSGLSVVEAALSDQNFELSIQQAIDEMIFLFPANRVFLAPLVVESPFGKHEQNFQAYFLATDERFSAFDAHAFMNEDEVKAHLSMMSHRSSNSQSLIDSVDMFSQELLERYHIALHLMALIQIKPGVFWLFAMQQCTTMNKYTKQDRRLFLDISDRIRGALSQLILQKDLQSTVARVEIASKAKSDFLATMSHELRTPLHGMIGLLDLLANDVGQLSIEQQRNLTLAQSSSLVLSSLIDDVLDLAKIESGKVELYKQAFVLKDALFDALVPFVMKAREKNLDLKLEMKNVAAVIEGDVLRLRQVLLNLVGNAIKFTHKGYVRIVVTQNQQVLQINIEDSGIGISPDKLEDVFNPFTQVHDIGILGDNLQEKGTGLGTTISDHFIAMMGGTLTLQSEPNIGSTLCIRIPLQQVGEERVSVNTHMSELSQLPIRDYQDAQVSSHEIVDVMQAGDWSVLLAEDDPIGRRVAVKQLQRAGFKVEAVADGISAWEMIQKQSFDLLLTDIRMPGLDGMKLSEKIRDYECSEHKKPMLIIGLSAYAMEEVRHEALAQGMDEFISKPVDMNALMIKLEARCERKMPVSEELED